MPETAETGLIVRHPAALTAAAPSINAAVGTAARPPGRRRRNRHWYRLVSPVAVVGLWQAASSTGILPASKLVSPASIAHTAYTLMVTNSPTYGTLQESLLVSCERWAAGFTLGIAIAVLLAVATGLSRIGEAIADPILHGLRRGEMIRHIMLPGALPQALTGLQLSVISSLLALVVGEQINATSGLGFMITQAQQFLNNSVIMVALIVYAILGLFLNGAVRLLERKALAWRHDFGK